MLPSLRKNVSNLAIPEHLNSTAAKTNHIAINHYALAISSKLCSIDGDLNLYEKRAFLVLFPYFKEDHIPMLKQAAFEDISTYLYCKRLCKFTNNDSRISAKLFARLFKLAVADEALNVSEISFLEKIAPMLGLTNKILEKALELYFLENIRMPRKMLNGRKTIKDFYRKQAIKLHPDIFQETSYLSESTRNKVIFLANERMKILNENYRKSFA